MDARGIAGLRRKTGKLLQSRLSTRPVSANIYDTMKENVLLGLVLVLVFVAGGISATLFFPDLSTEVERKEITEKPVEWNLTTKPLPEGVETYIVGTTEDGKGMVSSAWVRADPGVGKILVDIENLFFWVDIQHSIRTASSFSKEYLKIEKDRYDLTYSIDLDASIVGGPSAGGTLTVATIAALKNTSIKNDLVMTGTIQENGRIGTVGGILPKARAVEEEGFEKFLVPEGQSVQVTYTKEESCRSVGTVEICRTEYVEEKTDINQEVGIDVVEVGNIEEALGHFV